MSHKNEPYDPDDAIASFRKATDLHFCLKILDITVRNRSVAGAISRGHLNHTTPFCMDVKRTRNEQCRECDLRKVPTLCEQKRKPFVHTCHAGANELIIPIFTEGRLSAVAFVGQFRTRKSQPAELPLLKQTGQRQLLGLAPLLQSYLTERTKTPRFEAESSTGLRNEVIRTFLARNLPNEPTLAMLAQHLALSTTRTAHVVAEATGQSFTALRDAIRMDRATSLLQGTYYKIAQVARECGFASSQYFHRFFKEQTGVTPTEYRRRHRMDV